jgi:hypothetical protein
MTTTVAGARTMEGRRDRLRIGLGLLELFIGANALWGGVMLMADAWRMPTDWLRHSPFDDWFLPGLALIVLIGGSQLVAAVALLLRRRWARTASLLAGIGLIGWIVVQLAWLRIVHPVMQPTLFAAGCLITVLAIRLPRAGRP